MALKCGILRSSEPIGVGESGHIDKPCPNEAAVVVWIDNRPTAYLCAEHRESWKRTLVERNWPVVAIQARG